MRYAVTVGALWALSGCASVTAGQINAQAPAAYLSADPRINAGLPVIVALRKVDAISSVRFIRAPS